MQMSESSLRSKTTNGPCVFAANIGSFESLWTQFKSRLWKELGGRSIRLMLWGLLDLESVHSLGTHQTPGTAMSPVV